MRSMDELMEEMREATPEEAAIARDYMMQNSEPLIIAPTHSVTLVYDDEIVTYLFLTQNEAVHFLEMNYNAIHYDLEGEPVIDSEISDDHTRAFIETTEGTYMLFVGQVYL